MVTFRLPKEAAQLQEKNSSYAAMPTVRQKILSTA
jgi:hypothetical protein